MKSFIIEMVLFLIKYVCVCAFFGSFSDEIHFGKKKKKGPVINSRTSFAEIEK